MQRLLVRSQRPGPEHGGVLPRHDVGGPSWAEEAQQRPVVEEGILERRGREPSDPGGEGHAGVAGRRVLHTADGGSIDDAIRRQPLVEVVGSDPEGNDLFSGNAMHCLPAHRSRG